MTERTVKNSIVYFMSCRSADCEVCAPLANAVCTVRLHIALRKGDIGSRRLTSTLGPPAPGAPNVSSSCWMTARPVRCTARSESKWIVMSSSAVLPGSHQLQILSSAHFLEADCFSHGQRSDSGRVVSRMSRPPILERRTPHLSPVVSPSSVAPAQPVEPPFPPPFPSSWLPCTPDSPHSALPIRAGMRSGILGGKGEHSKAKRNGFRNYPA